ETNLEDSRLAKIFVTQETRLLNDCSIEGDFGVQRISAFVRSGVGEEWQAEPGVQSSFRNKYLFSTSEVHADEELYIFTTPVYFPYKVADLTIIWSDLDSYCFAFDSNAGAQAQIREELSNLDPENVELVSSVGECSDSARKICFKDGASCDVLVSL